MSQQRNSSYTVNDSNKNSDVSDRRSRTSVLRDSNKSTLFERLTFTVPSSSSYMKNNVEKEHEKKELINNEDVDI